ncbi:MarR family winged helix-turn-helix transcriptional regulator [Streptomyces sp. NPDC014734]|uniref:MarR family winged helix-turn-helix transcriptional regulator n=1 Tax=Streptomyces sp. NPDC014734 TaxID=3364886 RepID=UPI0036F7BC56
MTDARTARPQRPDPPSALEDALSHLQCVLVARRTATNPEHINWQQYDVLETLRIRGAMSPSRLSDALGVSRQTASKALRVLKDLELVRQTAHGEDRREQTTSLTPKGHTFLTQAAWGRRENADAAAGALSPGERALFAEMCQKVADSVAALRHGAPAEGGTPAGPGPRRGDVADEGPEPGAV